MASDAAAWQVLHPASIGVNLLPRAWRVVRNLWPLLLALLWRGTDDDGGLLWFGVFDAAILGVFFVMTVGGTVWHWLTLRYRVHDGRLEIRTGWLNRQVRSIDPARVQNVELVAGPVHRLAGLVEVRIETASGTDVEGLLSALSLDEAEALRSDLVRLRDRARADAPDPDQPPVDRALAENSPADLLAYAATAGRLGAAAVMLGLAFEALTWLAPERLGDVTLQIFGLQGVALALALLSAAWLIGVAGTMALHWNTRLIERDRALAVEAGLFTRRRLELPLRKVQVAITSETLVRRLLGFGTLTLETAAARVGAGGTERRAALVPHVPHDRLAVLAAIAVPDLDIDPWSATYRPPHPRALARALGRRTIQIALLTAVATWFAGPWALALGLLVVPAGAVAWLDHRHQGWIVTDHAILARRGYLDRRLVVVSRRRLQSVVAVQGPLLQRLGLGAVVVRVAGTSVTLPLMSWREATELVRGLVRPA